MADLPTGTVTFLFTDIEGSTRLLEELGKAYRPLLEDHRRLLREAIENHGGIPLSTEGDAVFAVFTGAPQAVAAAVAAQQALGSHPWPQGARVPVRMGLHTGDGVLGGDGYVGLDVHRAARVASAAWGGQVLVSGAARGLVEGALPEGVGLRDLGEHRLKDLTRPERLSQLIIPGLPSEFPPLRTLEVAPHNLPVQLTSFIGRKDELAKAIRLLEGTRMLTLTGPGGTGKTRLALQVAAEVADRFPHGVFFVPLAPVTHPDLVPSAIATTLGLTQASGSPLEHLHQYLADREVLLVLDNFEQVVGVGPQVAELLRSAPRLRVLATSRAPLRISGEQELPVDPLDVPAPADPPETLAGSEAVALFVERASAARADFRLTAQNAPAVAQITARLDGLPLAIELAAARIKLLTPEAIAARLGDRLGLLTGGPRDLPGRQQTLRDAIGWSYDLLDLPARRLFARLSVFRGEVALAQLEAVCGPSGELGADLLEGLGTLVDQSLLRQQEAAGEPRFAMLETIREFASERLAESEQAPEIARRHAHAYLVRAEEAARHVPSWSQAAWLDRLERDHNNLRGALEWAVEEGDTDLALRLGAALWRFWQIRGHLEEAAGRLAEVLALGGGDPSHRALALEAAGGVAYWQGNMEEAARRYRESLERTRELGDREGEANALYNLAYPLLFGDDSHPDEAGLLLRRSLHMWREIGDQAGIAKALYGMGSVAWMAEDWERARSLFEECLESLRGLDDPFHLGWTLFMIGSAEMRDGRSETARPLLEEGLRIFGRLSDVTGILFHLHYFIAHAIEKGQPERAVRLVGAAARLREMSGAALVEKLSYEIPELEASYTRLASQRAEELLAEGQAMSLEEIVAYALANEPGH